MLSTRHDSVIYDRQIQIFDPGQFSKITIAIIGLGNIGSNAGIQLARLGLINFILIDHDHVESHNLNSQHYTVKDNGKSKAESLAGQMKKINPKVKIITKIEEYHGESLDASILISAVDSMTIRADINAGMIKNKYAPFVIDGRAGGGQLEIHSQPAELWGATLVADADTDPCGARFIGYASTIIGGMIANQTKRHLRDESLKAKILFHCDTYQILTA